MAWVAFKVGALSYGGGFVIIPLMQHDAVHTYHWMTASAVPRRGRARPGHARARWCRRCAVVGYAAAGVGGGLLAALVAFAPSFLFVLGGWPPIRPAPGQRGGPGVPGRGRTGRIGAIAGSAVPLALALSHLWQLGLLALAAIWLLGLRRGVVSTIVGAAGLGVLAFAAGAPWAEPDRRPRGGYGAGRRAAPGSAG